MFFFLIELYVLGVLITSQFHNRLPRLFLALSGILAGYLVYILNGMLVLGFGFSWTKTLMIGIVNIELFVLILLRLLERKKTVSLKHLLTSEYVVVGLIYFILLVLFFRVNLSYSSNDSFYLIIMGRNLIDTGFSQWFFATPAWTGIYIPAIQTIGMIFGYDYVWFVQPVLFILFLVFFLFFASRVTNKLVNNKVKNYLFVAFLTILFISSNLIFIMSTYIHTNFNSALFFFLATMSFYFAVEEENSSWLFTGAIFLISFGFLRIENVIMAMLLILVYLANQKIKQINWIRFVFPYLLIQFLWYARILFMDIDTYLDNMSQLQIMLILVGIIGMVILILLSEKKIFRLVVLPVIDAFLPILLLLLLMALAIPQNTGLLRSLRSVLTAIFFTGNWGSLWWILVIILIIIPNRNKWFQQRNLLNIIISFPIIIQLLGLFRSPYHSAWYDSANRMLVHIVPVILFYIVRLVATAQDSKVSDKNQNTIQKIEASPLNH